jgi:hypothetical protein
VHVFSLGPNGTTWTEQQELVMKHGAGLGLNVSFTGPESANATIFE